MASGLAVAASQERPEAVRVCCKKPPMRERATTIAVFSVCHLRSNSERMLPSALKRSQKHVSCTRRAPQIIDRAVPCSFLSFFPLGMNALSFSSVALSYVVFFRDRGLHAAIIPLSMSLRRARGSETDESAFGPTNTFRCIVLVLGIRSVLAVLQPPLMQAAGQKGNVCLTHVAQGL